MIRTFVWKLVLGAALAGLGCGGQAPGNSVVPVFFDVTVTDVLPAGASVTIAGTHSSLGWDAAQQQVNPLKGLKLRQQPDGRWTGGAYLPRGEKVQYWAMMANPSAEELNAAGDPVKREITPGAVNDTQTFTVERWAAPTEIFKPCIKFRAEVPAGTPASDTVFIVGNQPEIGPWDPGKTAMTKAADGRWEISICFAVGTELEYKYTRGSWAQVEKDAAGGEIPNRTLSVSEEQTKLDTIIKWADQ